MKKKTTLFVLLSLFLLLLALFIAPNLIELSIYQSKEIVSVNRTKNEPSKEKKLSSKLELVNREYRSSEEHYLEKEKLTVADKELRKLFSTLELPTQNIIPVFIEPVIYEGTVFWRGQFIIPEMPYFYGNYIIDDETEKIVQLSFYDYQPINEVNQKELIKKHLNYLGLEEKETKEHQGSYEVVLKDGEKVDFTFEKGMYYFNTSVVIDATEPQAIRRK
ncbi:hypothetical protein [Vagococcus fluvialis]|uniref:hypothetical protein n=1 Tax=Vagococcus fluvialis TaxID=2738 RepID=UPI002B299092|nr:hypothetical protein QDW48_03640 [Vagococcus fluvialis]